MTTTTVLPLKGLQAWYDDSAGTAAISLYLLSSSGAVLDGDALITDVDGALATTGAYNSSTGIDAGDWPLNYDTASGVMELSLPDSVWTSTASYSLTYQWIVVTLPGGYIACAIDLGAAQSLSGAPLEVYALESVYIANSYPVLRWRKSGV